MAKSPSDLDKFIIKPMFSFFNPLSVGYVDKPHSKISLGAYRIKIHGEKIKTEKLLFKPYLQLQ